MFGRPMTPLSSSPPLPQRPEEALVIALFQKGNGVPNLVCACVYIGRERERGGGVGWKEGGRER